MAVESDNPDWQLPEPRWRSEDLGHAIPDNEHACSVCMPLWEHNVAYEEGDEAVTSLFRTGYPRFFMHPSVSALIARLATQRNWNPDSCLILPSRASASRCAAYVLHRTGQHAEIETAACGVWLLRTCELGRPALREFWQHAGELVSSRSAMDCLSGKSLSISTTAAKVRIRERVADLQHVDPEDVYLFPSGMAAIYTAWRITQGENPAIQFGFPYVDTYKILERFGDRPPWFFPVGSDTELSELEHRLTSERASALFCEVPGNPLLTTPDTSKLSRLCQSHSIPMIIDDTLGAMVNTDVRPHADLIATSLTKFFSGSGDTLAGSLIVIPNKPNYHELKQRLDVEYEDLLTDADAEVLAANCGDVEQRVACINNNAAKLVDALRSHPAVEHVFYPGSEDPAHFDAIRDPQFPKGNGGLLSVVLKNAAETAPKAYNALQVSKGPNLGTNFTLCCPYTILAHYNELDFVQKCGVSPYLLRISVGLEGADWVVARVLQAIEAATATA